MFICTLNKVQSGKLKNSNQRHHHFNLLEFNKDFNLANNYEAILHNTTFNDFETFFKKSLFQQKIKCCHKKENLVYYNKHQYLDYAVHYNFLWYGNQSASKFIIVDIDNVDIEMNNFIDIVLKDFKPNWITKTTRGYHIGFITKDTMFYDNKETKKQIKFIKSNLNTIFGADKNATNRTNGFYRNPLTHTSYLSTNKNDLNSLSEDCYKYFTQNNALKTYIKPKTKKSFAEKDFIVNENNFKQGNRNNYIFNYAIFKKYSCVISDKNLLRELLIINARSKNPLKIKEIEKIHKTVVGYEIKANLNKKTEEEEYTYEKGIFNDYLYENKIHNYKDKKGKVFLRQKFGQKVSACIKVKNTINIIYQSMSKNIKIGISNNNQSIAKNIIDRTSRTVRNYKEVITELNKIVAKDYFKELVSNARVSGVLGKVFIANFQSIKTLINNYVSMLYFEDKKLDYVYIFKFEDESSIKALKIT